LANVWEIVLIVVGILLVVLEVFVIPGFGIAGISGLIFFFAGLLMTFVPDEPGRSFPIFLPTVAKSYELFTQGVAALVTSMIVSLAGMVVLRNFLPRMPYLNQLVPANPTPSQVQVDDAYFGAARVGDLGEAAGPLHPSGKARFGAVLVDVVTQGEYLDENAAVEVVERHGNRVVVRSVRT
jgi:membrane-bound serine protease (ClpP class)